MLDPYRLRLLRELAYRETITAVAHALGYTPSAVSQQLTVLERESGVALLERSARRVRLTPAGRTLVEHAENVLDHLERAQAALAQTLEKLTGTFQIGAFPSAARVLLPPTLVELSQRHPGLELMIHECDPADAAVGVRSGDLDVALTQDYDLLPVPEHPALVSSVVLTEPMIFASSQMPADLVEPIGSARTDTWIMGKPGTGCRQAAERICHVAGFQPRVRHQSDDFPTVLALVAAGQGVSVLPRMGTLAAPPGVVLTPLPSSTRVRITQRRGTEAHPAIAAFRASLEQAVDHYRGSTRGSV